MRGYGCLCVAREGHLQELEVWIANHRAPGAWGGGGRLEVKEATCAKEVGDPAKAKDTWDRRFEEAWEVCVENADTIIVWGFVDCNVALDAAVVGI